MLTRRNFVITAAEQILNAPNRIGQGAGEALVRSPWRAWLRRQRYSLALALVAAAVFFGCMVSPPSLMDDIDASHAQLARNMIRSGDWVIPRLDGVPYVEKAPLPYWLIAVSYLIFGVHDWAARIPFALAAAVLCWITARYGLWGFDSGGGLENSPGPDGAVPGRAGFYAGLVLATCVGLFLFTRTLLPDVMVALCVCIAFWAFQRALDKDASIAFADERHPRRWAALLAAALGVGVMLKGLIALVVVLGGAMAYLAITRQLFRRETWRRLHLVSGACIFLIIAAPWHVLAALRLPPAFAFTLNSGPGQYHGFFWFYFINEHVLRFLGVRYPHDYNTVPRPAFWLFNLLWLFPWSVYLPAVVKLSYKPVDRAGRTRLLALCWIGFLMLFFTFSTTQEYYSLPIYPALALLLGCAMNAQSTKESGGRWLKRSNRILGVISAAAAMAVAFVLYAVRRVPAPGDIAHALHQQNIQAYTLSLGHVGDLNINSFAYLRGPLVLAGLAFLVGAAGAWLLPGRHAFAAIAVMMVLFFHASRLALVVFDPYLSSRPLAEALRRAPEGPLIVDGDYYPFSSVFFYSDRTALLLNGRMNNLEYGSYAPGVPSVFIDDQKFEHLWASPLCYYLVTDGTRLKPLGRLAGAANLHVLAESGGKFLLTNHLTSGETEIQSALW